MQPVSVIIPAYNEEGAIGDVLQHLLQVLNTADLVYEVLVVDDGSKDNTAAVVQQVGGITLLRHRVNKGYGAALKTGIRQAQYDLICITDADGTYPNDRIPSMVTHMEAGEFDMVVGARTGENVAIPLVRRPAKWALGKLANYVAGETIPDLNSGLRIFRRAIALRMFNMLPDKFSFTTTITLAMLTNRYLVDYMPVDYYARVGKSKIKPVQDTINFMQLVMRIALYFAPLRFFVPMSLLLMILGISWATYTLVAWGRVADVSTMIVMMTAFQVMVIGLLAELINRRVPNVYQE